MMDATITVTGDKAIERTLLLLAARAGNFQPALEAVAGVLMEDVQQQFDENGQGRWAPDRPESVRKKVAAGLDPRVMRATLALERSLTNRGDSEQELNVSAYEVTLGSRLPYAGRQLRRRPVVITAAARLRTHAILSAWLTGGWL